jgi:hypothetical protein
MLDVGGHGLLEVIAARERQPAVRVVLADRRPGRLHRGCRGWDVGVEVLQAKDVGVVAGRRGDPIDVEAGCAQAAGRSSDLLLAGRVAISNSLRHVSPWTGNDSDALISHHCVLEQVATCRWFRWDLRDGSYDQAPTADDWSSRPVVARGTLDCEGRRLGSWVSLRIGLRLLGCPGSELARCSLPDHVPVRA